MATIRTRRNADGKVTSYRVEWRTGGTRAGSWDAETFSVKDHHGIQRAERAAKQFRAQVEANGHRRDRRTAVADDTLTVSALVTAYIDDSARRVRSDRTTADYRAAARLWIDPDIGQLPAEDLEPERVQAWADAIPRAPKTVANVHGLLSAAFAWGLRRRHVTFDPTRDTRLIERTPVIRGLRPGEWALLHQAASDLSPDAADLLLFLVGTGWRWSEATALPVHAVELDRAEPYAEVTRVWRRNGANEFILVNDAKSRAGVRRTRLSPLLAQMLTRRTTGKALGDLVFTAPNGGPLRYSNFHRREWKPITARARELGLTRTPRLHDLRHTQVALMLEAGASLPALQRRIGHESIKTTIDTYGRLVDDVGQPALDALDAALLRRAPLRSVGQ